MRGGLRSSLNVAVGALMVAQVPDHGDAVVIMRPDATRIPDVCATLCNKEWVCARNVEVAGKVEEGASEV